MGIDGGGHGFGSLGRVDCAELGSEAEDVRTEDLVSRDDAIGEGGDGGLQEGAQASGLELEAKDATVALHGAGKFSGGYAGDFGVAVNAGVVGGLFEIMFEDEIAVGMGKGFGGAGCRAAKVPLDVPEMLNEGCECRRGCESLVEVSVAAVYAGVQNAAGRTYGWRK